MVYMSLAVNLIGQRSQMVISNNHIVEHHLQTNHKIDWDSAECITYSTNYYQRLTLESWFTNLKQTPLNRCLQLPAPYKRLRPWLHETGTNSDRYNFRSVCLHEAGLKNRLMSVSLIPVAEPIRITRTGLKSHRETM